MTGEYTAEDIFDDLSTILDPEKPCTLADLGVVAPDRCSVQYLEGKGSRALVEVVLKPTVPHCHLMMLIALSVRARLEESLPVLTKWKVDISVVPGTHLQEDDINRQVNDKERVAAALENPPLRKEVDRLINPFRDA